MIRFVFMENHIWFVGDILLIKGIIILTFPILYFFSRKEVFKKISYFPIALFGYFLIKNIYNALINGIPEMFDMSIRSYIYSSTLFIAIAFLLLFLKAPLNKKENIIDSNKPS